MRPFLTVLQHADEGDNDQKVDVFHHYVLHVDGCVLPNQVDAEAVGDKKQMQTLYLPL